MPLKIREFIQAKRVELQKRQLQHKGIELAQKAKEASIAKRYNALAKTEAKIDREIQAARAHQKANSTLGRIVAEVGKAREEIKRFKKQRLKPSNKGNTGFGGNPFG